MLLSLKNINCSEIAINYDISLRVHHPQYSITIKTNDLITYIPHHPNNIDTNSFKKLGTKAYHLSHILLPASGIKCAVGTWDAVGLGAQNGNIQLV